MARMNNPDDLSRYLLILRIFPEQAKNMDNNKSNFPFLNLRSSGYLNNLRNIRHLHILVHDLHRIELFHHFCCNVRE